MEPVIKTKNLSVVYALGKSNEFTALEDVNIEIYPGEYVIFYGPSGCGKSTLLYCLAGLETPTRGEIFVAGKSLADLSPEKIVSYRRLQIGMIFQAYNLISTLNILDNVLLPNIFGGLIPEASKNKAVSLLAQFGISNLVNRYPRELSGGQQQRVAIARALIYWPPILIADEPVGNLDSVSAKIVMNTLTELNEKDKKTVILVTHDPFYLDYAHRVFHIKDGRIIREVVNPKRVQIVPQKEQMISVDKVKTAIATKPLSQTHQLFKPSVLAQYLLTSLDHATIKRLENIIEKRILGKINETQFKEILDKPFEQGGAGFYRGTAESFSQKLERILAEAEFLKEEIKVKKPLSEIDVKTKELRKYLLDDSKIVLKTEEELSRIEHFIRLRLKERIDKKRFQKYLDLPFKKGGAGLNKRTARNFAQKLEIVLFR